MKSPPSLPWRKVRHQAIGDRIIKLTNRCVWVIDVSNPLGGPQGKCQLINNTLLWTGSSLLQSVSLPLPGGAKACPMNILFTYYILKGMKGHCFHMSPSLKSPTSLSNNYHAGRKKNQPLSSLRERNIHVPLSKENEETLPLPALISKNILPVTVTGI